MHRADPGVLTDKPGGAPARVRPEVELLICCARTHAHAEIVERIRALVGQDLDWPYLLRAARTHGMIPLLYWHLDAICPTAVPDAPMDELRVDFHWNTALNLWLARELVRILELFEAEGISGIPFKGPVLAASAYGHLALRMFADLDILVHERDVLRVKGLLTSHGYRPQFELTARQEAALFRSHYEYPFTSEDQMVVADIHWKIRPRYFSFPLDPDRLWDRLEPMALLGKKMLTLSRDDSLLILCVHGTKHVWDGLRWICDIAELVRVRDIDWGRVMEQAVALRSERMVCLGLYLASDLLGTSLPGAVARRVQADAKVRSLAREIYARLFRDPEVATGIMEGSLFHLRARERLQDRVRYCLRLAVTPTVEDWRFLPLPGPLSFLYYLVRPIRLVRKYGFG